MIIMIIFLIMLSTKIFLLKFLFVTENGMESHHLKGKNPGGLRTVTNPVFNIVQKV